MSKAVHDVQQNRTPVVTAAKKHGVSERSLYRYIRHSAAKPTGELPDRYVLRSCKRTRQDKYNQQTSRIVALEDKTKQLSEANKALNLKLEAMSTLLLNQQIQIGKLISSQTTLSHKLKETESLSIPCVVVTS